MGCGKSGVLKTQFTILPTEPEMSLAAATTAACERAPARFVSLLGTTLEPTTIVADPSRNAACWFRMFSPDTVDFHPFWSVSVTPGRERCSFSVKGEMWLQPMALIPGNYRGPKREEYTETCKSLR